MFSQASDLYFAPVRSPRMVASPTVKGALSSAATTCSQYVQFSQGHEKFYRKSNHVVQQPCSTTTMFKLHSSIGETRLVLHVPSSSRAGKRYYCCCYFHYFESYYCHYYYCYCYHHHHHYLLLLLIIIGSELCWTFNLRPGQANRDPLSTCRCSSACSALWAMQVSKHTARRLMTTAPNHTSAKARCSKRADLLKSQCMHSIAVLCF